MENSKSNYEKNKEYFQKYFEEYYKKNKDKLKEYQKERRANLTQEQKDKINLLQRRWRKDNLEKVRRKQREYYYKNRERRLFLKKRYEIKNKENISLKRRIYEKERKNKDSLYNLMKKIRVRMRRFLKSKNIRKDNSIMKIIGCNLKELKNHLESQFTKNMSWDLYNKGYIHTDHIIPLSTGKNEEEIYKLCHYSNLQPLWANENITKGNKIN